MTTLPAVVRIVDLPTGTTITGAELFEVVQTSNGVGLSIQVPISQVMTTSLGGLPTGGATGQILSKASGTNFSSNWSSISSFVTVNGTTLATSGSATAILINVASGGIGSNQLGTFAVQSLNVATNAIGNVQLRQGSPLSIIGVAGVATANVADIIATGAGQVLQVNAGATGLLFTTIVNASTFAGITNTGLFSQTGTVLATGTFGIVGTTLVTGIFGVVGTANFTGSHNVTGTTLFTSNTFGVVGTTLVTGTFGQVGTSLMTGLFGISGTTNITGFLTNVGSAIFTGGTFGVNGTANFTGIHSVVGTTLFTSGTFGVVGTTLFTSGAFGIVGTTLVTGVVGVVGTSNFTGAVGIVGTTNVTGTLIISSSTAGMLVSSSTGVVSSKPGGLVLLNTLSPSNVASTNDTTSFSSTYTNYLFLFENVCPAANTSFFQMQIATSGANFVSGSYVSSVNAIVNAIGGIDASTTSLLLTGVRATTSMQTTTIAGFSGFIRLFNPANTVIRKYIVGEGTYASANAATLGTTSLGFSLIWGVFDGNSNAVTGVNFSFNTGNIQTGTIRIYGIQ